MTDGERDDERREPPTSVRGPWRRRADSLATGVRVRTATARTAVRAFLRRRIPNEAQHLFALTLVVGAVCGVVAVAFHLAIQAAEKLLIERAMSAPGRTWMAWTIVTPTLGGLVAGAALTWVFPGARGSGIPQVKQAFATEGGRVRFRDALGKFVIGAFQIGSGASLGREGPTVQICAGAASLLARVTALPPRNMRRLTPVGVAAGIAAAFNAPIAAVTFTIEEIVGTLDQAVLSGVVVAAALAAVIERGILGVHPVIEVHQSYGLDHASSLPLYALLGIVAAGASIAFTDGLLRTRAWFRRVPVVPPWAQPAVGGLVTGALAVVALRFLGATGVNGGGYDTLGRALAGELGTKVLLALGVIKLVATVMSYSSGGAGGIFAPSLFVGAMLGGAAGSLDSFLLGHEGSQTGAFALVGMGAVFAGVIRAPITSVLIIFEMTGGYGLVLPLMLANMTSYMITRRLRPVGIYEALLDQDGVHLPQTIRTPHTAELLRTSDAMTSDVVSARASELASAVLGRIGERSFAIVPVVDEAGVVRGSVSVADLRAAQEGQSLSPLVRPAHVIRADDALSRAMVRMNDLGVRQLIVVDEGGTELVGVLAMSDVVRSHARALRGHEHRASVPSFRPPPELRASGLMMPAVVVPASARLPALVAKVREESARSFLVPGTGTTYSLLLPSYLDEFSRDDEFAQLLIAADLARPAPTVAATADADVLLRALGSGPDDAAIVLDADGEPTGVVTRAALANAVLGWYATQASSGALAS